MAKKSKSSYKDNDYLFQEKQKLNEVLQNLGKVENTEFIFEGDISFKNMSNKDEVLQTLGFYKMFDKEDHIELARAFKKIIENKMSKLDKKINDVFSLKDAGLSTIDLFDESSPISF